MAEATASSSTPNRRQQAMIQPGDVDSEMLETWMRSDQLDPAQLAHGVVSKPEAARRGRFAPRLAHRHNLKSFLMTLYVSLGESKGAAQRERLLPYVRRELKLK
ncbi:hypothetical protein CR103_13570 [Massilia psychrophila]|jgi:hypothetical protein|uniref:Uncharacterized protein n=2 Tax=Massilia psychrophila TaxID=1603353 RepID=A0A2G8SZL0_9BURK|nr:hypothetical protein [Massilia psychrophila]PIL39230.1 hypothetical protein CR103_13570 [Massilia psychrophila]GGE87577.1 hypothetical protein GCM10008020_35620 [Massilia psychrophila]